MLKPDTTRMALPFKDSWLGLIISAALLKAPGFHGRVPHVPSTRERKRTEARLRRGEFALA